jgi:hypothetical protein
MKKLLLIALLIAPMLTFAQTAWINEIHYDNFGSDVDEFVEVVIKNPGSFDLSLFKIQLYNGNDGFVYDTKTVNNFVVGSTSGTYTYYSFTYPANGIQNGAPDGIALSYNGVLIQFLSYEGTFNFVAVGGDANGVTSTRIGVLEAGTEAAGSSLQLIGSLTATSVYADFTWGGPITSTKGTANPTTLPISLTSFTGKEANKSILLNWVTASEKNNKNFELFRSVDGKNFKSIGTVAGAGDSNAELKYSFVDANPFGGTNYYQLKQIDFDGKSSTSSIIPVDSKIEDTKITVYATSKVNISITSPNETSGKLSLFDISGRKISEQNISLNKGYNSLELKDNLNPGIHFITLENEGKLYRQKFMK